MSGEHVHLDYEARMDALEERVEQLEQPAVVEPPIEPPVEPPPATDQYLWETVYEDDPWWDRHGVIGVAHQASHDLATTVINDPFDEFAQVVKADCLVNTVLDTAGTTYGFTDRCSFEAMGLCESDANGLAEIYSALYVAVPADWGEAEDDVRWRTQSGSCKMPNTFGSYDPARGSGSQPYSNNFAALAWASNLGCILKGPPSLTDYDRDRNRPSTFFSVARAAGQTRTPVANGTKVAMIQLYFHLNPDPKDLVTGVGSGSKPYVYFERGRWHKVETYIRTNRAGQADGEYKSWWDGDLVMHINDLQLMPSTARGINIWHNQYFHGGPSGLDSSQSMLLGPAGFDSSRLIEL